MGIPQLLSGDKRSTLLEQLRLLLDESSHLSSDEVDEAAANLARIDPSVMTDRLGSEFGPQIRVRFQDDSNRDIYLPTAGTLCMFAAKMKMPKLLEVALSAGVGPDDPDVFLVGGLLSYGDWSRTGPLLSLALKYAANPDAPVQPDGAGFWPGTPGQVALQNALLYRRDSNGQYLQTVKQLLVAGAKVIGFDRRSAKPALDSPSAVWQVSDAAFWDVRADGLVAEMIPLMKAIGEDIDSHCGKLQCPPVIAAARSKKMGVVVALIDAGCRVDDGHILRQAHAKVAAVESLMVEVDKANGCGARSLVIEALMRRHLANQALPTSASLAQNAESDPLVSHRRSARAL